MFTFSKKIIMAMLLTIGTFSMVGCSGGEADYSFDDVQINQFIFLSSGYVYVEDNVTEIIELQVRSQSSVEFEIIGGDDSALYDINSTTGIITYAAGVDGVQLYIQDPEKIYLIVVQAINADGDEESMVIRVQIVKDLTLVKPVIDTSVDTTPNLLPSLDEVITTVTAQSATNTTITYTLSGADSVFFTIDENGNLRFATIPGFDPAEDANGDNVYEVTVEVSDAYQTSTVDIHVTIAEDSDLVKPTITSSVFDYVEEVNTSLQIIAQSGTSSAITYSLVPGYDESSFTIEETTGLLYFLRTPDYEAPEDSDGDNVYNVEIRVTDDSAFVNTTTKLMSITVSGINEGIPGFSDSYVSLHNDSLTEVGTEDLVELTHYTMLFHDVAIVPTDAVTLMLAAYDPSDWSSDKNQYDANIFSIVNDTLSIQTPSIFSFIGTQYETYYVRVIATDEHGNSSFYLLSVRARSN